jgi:hypothetical protein
MYSPPTLGFEFSHRTEPYGTHQPVLWEAISRTNGSNGRILELGSGHNSSPLIRAIAREDRDILTVDHDAAWLDQFRTLRGQFQLISDWKEILDIVGYYSVIFVDQGDWQSRADALVHFSLLADILVLHDSDYLERNGMIKYDERFQYVKTFMPLEPYPYMTGPPTTIMSNYTNVAEWDIDYKRY